MRHNITMIAAALAFASCGGNANKADDPQADTGRTQRTENLLNNLKALGDSSVYLFGHHDDTVYGIGWEADYSNDSTIHQRSDVKNVCNDFPALLSFDLSHIERGDTVNADGVPFSRINQEVIAHYDRGGLIMLSWTVSGEPKTDHVAKFLQSLKTPYGVRVPVVFRLRGTFSANDWRTVHQQLKDYGVVNALFAYSPSTDSTVDETAYMKNYPGDDIIDVLGLDYYCYAPEADTTQIALFAEQLDKNLGIICRIAKQHGKIAALTETGYEHIRTTDWWTKTLAPVLTRHPISYVLVWSNSHSTEGSFFAPYPGHRSVSDFIHFYNMKQTLFLHDVNALYL